MAFGPYKIFSYPVKEYQLTTQELSNCLEDCLWCCESQTVSLGV